MPAPTSLLPVKETARTASWSRIALPTALPEPRIRFKTPFGRPARSKMRNHGRGGLGRQRRGLEHDRVAADERGRDLPDRDRDREVPRRDARDDAERVPQRVAEVARQLGGDRLAAHAPAFCRDVLEDVDAALDLAERLLEGLAFLAGQQPRQVFLLLVEDRHGAEQHGAPLGRGRVAPFRETRPRPRPRRPGPRRASKQARGPGPRGSRPGSGSAWSCRKRMRSTRRRCSCR